MAEPMSAERLAEIEARNARDVQAYDAVGLSEAEADRFDLVAEVERLRDELAQSWTTHLNTALVIITARQVADAEQLTAMEAGRARTSPHGPPCGSRDACHSTEAHAALARVFVDLEALKARGPELDAVTEDRCGRCKSAPIQPREGNRYSQFCERCINRCHQSTESYSAHACVICDPEWLGGGQR